MVKTPRQSESFEPRKKAKNGPVQAQAGQAQAGSSSGPPGASHVSPTRVLKSVEAADPGSASSTAATTATTTAPVSPQLSRSSAWANIKEALTGQKTIVGAWSHVNDNLAGNPDQDPPPTLQILMDVLRVVEGGSTARKSGAAAKELQQGRDVFMATLTSLLDATDALRGEIADMKTNTVTFAALEELNAQLEGKITSLTEDLKNYHGLTLEYGARTDQLSISTDARLGDIKNRMATSDSVATATASISDKIAAVEGRLATMQQSTTKTARLAKKQNAANATIVDSIERQNATMKVTADKLADTQQVLVAAARVGKEIPRMGTQLATFKFCVQKIAQRLDVPDVHEALAKLSSRTQLRVIRHAADALRQQPQFQANAAAAAESTAEGATTPPPGGSPTPEPVAPPPRRRAVKTAFRRNISQGLMTSTEAQIIAIRGTGQHRSGRMDSYVVRSGRARK